MDIDNILKGIETIIFCDESKFYIHNGDFEDAIYYFGVSVEKRKIPFVNAELLFVLEKHRIQAKVFHATTLFKESRPRSEFMNDLTQIIIDNELKCFCNKYPKELLFGLTKSLKNYNSDILNFEKAEFQALFYFLIILNSYLKDEKPNLLRKEISMYFDRNVYGIKGIEAFNFSSDNFILKQMTFSEKSLIGLLALPDFFGYIFRKTKNPQNKIQFGDNSEMTKLIENSNKCLTDISNANLFHFLEFDINALQKALKIST